MAESDFSTEGSETAKVGTDEQEVQRGWLNYFRGTSIHGKLRDVDSWLRNRLRYCIWHDWKKPERKRKNLIRLGVDNDHAYAWSRTRKGGWAIAQSPILVTTITLKRLKQKGYDSLLDVYFELNPCLHGAGRLPVLCEPPNTRPAWFILSAVEGFGGVRGALRQFFLAEPSTRLCVKINCKS